MAKSKTISDFLDALRQLIAACRGKRKLSDYIEAAEKAADQEIVRTLSCDTVRYIGGKCFFTWNDIKQEVEGKIVLYFVREGSEYFQKSMTQNIGISKLDEADLLAFRKKGRLTFDIFSPKNEKN